MSNAQRMANALMGELVRLVKLDVADPESVKMECARATAINGTCKTLIDLGEFQARMERANESGATCGIIMGDGGRRAIPAYERVALGDAHGDMPPSMDGCDESRMYHPYGAEVES